MLPVARDVRVRAERRVRTGVLPLVWHAQRVVRAVTQQVDRTASAAGRRGCALQETIVRAEAAARDVGDEGFAGGVLVEQLGAALPPRVQLHRRAAIGERRLTAPT